MVAGKTNQQHYYLTCQISDPVIDSLSYGSGGCGAPRGRRPQDTLGNSSDRFARNSIARRSSSCSRVYDRQRNRQVPPVNREVTASGVALVDDGCVVRYHSGYRSSALRNALSVRKYFLVRRAIHYRRRLSVSADDIDYDASDPQVQAQLEQMPSWLQTITAKILGSLEEDQLKLLLPALKTGGGDMGNCVLSERNEIYVPAWGGLCVGPHVILMLFFRWRDFPHPPQPPPPLRRLSCCIAEDQRNICVNPYHWSMTLSPYPSKWNISANLY